MIALSLREISVNKKEHDVKISFAFKYISLIVYNCRKCYNRATST